MSKFRHATKPSPDPAALEAFAKGADSCTLAPVPATTIPAEKAPPKHVTVRMDPQFSIDVQMYCLRHQTSVQKLTIAHLEDLLRREANAFAAA